MSHSYAVRITYPYETIKPLMEIWAEKCEKMAIYEHTGERTNKVHIHLVIERCSVTKDQLKNYAKPTPIVLKGNGNCSFKKFDGNEKAYVYMAKGVLDPKFLKGWTQEDAQRWKSLWVGEKGHSQRKENVVYDDCFDEIVYESAWRYHQRDNPRGDQSINDYQFEFIRKWAHTYTFNKMGRIWNIQAINLYKMLVYTFVYRNNIRIPEKDKTFQRW